MTGGAVADRCRRARTDSLDRPDLADVRVQLGDCNGDGVFNNQDASAFIALITGSATPGSFQATIELDRNQYGYDAASSRTWELNLKASRSEQYAYDGLRRLVSMKRGELDTGRGDVPSPTRSQAWSLDALGNSRSVTSSSGGTSVTETRTHNAANEITRVQTGADPVLNSLASTGGSPGDSSPRVLGDSHAPTLRQALLTLLPWYRQQSGRNLSFNAFVRLLQVDPATLDTPPGGGSAASGSMSDPAAGTTSANAITTPLVPEAFYDAAGNLVVDPQASSTTYVYDAWNRMVTGKSSGTILASYAYDGRGFRVMATSSGTTVHDYFNDSWQVIEQRVGSSTSARSQLVWSVVYVDALLQEKRDTDANGSLDRTLYATHDANFNVTAAVRSDGVAAQRYLYDAYGERSVLALDWQPTTTAALLDHGHQGGGHDASSGLVLFRHRYLSPNLMRWTTRDPAGYVDGGSLYQYVRSQPTALLDPSGLSPNRDDARTLDWLIQKAKALQSKNPEKTPCEIVKELQAHFDGEPRYIYTVSAGWIDLNHFFNASQHYQLTSVVGGLLFEVGQLAAASIPGLSTIPGVGSSAFTSEDLNSNALGALFGEHVRSHMYRNDRGCMECSAASIESLLRDFFSVLAPVPPEEAPNWHLLAESEADHEAEFQALLHRPVWSGGVGYDAGGMGMVQPEPLVWPR